MSKTYPRPYASQDDAQASLATLKHDDHKAQRNLTRAILRDAAADAIGRTRPDRLSGCACGGIGDTGAHSQGCPWAPHRRRSVDPSRHVLEEWQSNGFVSVTTVAVTSVLVILIAGTLQYAIAVLNIASGAIR